MSGLIDPQLPQRWACCILESATAILSDHGIPKPGRVEFLQHRFDVFPGCCSALLLRDATVTNTTSGDDDCGLASVQIQWELQYTDCMTIRDPKQLADGSCDMQSGSCRDVLRCPPVNEPHKFPDDGCNHETKAEETDRLSSARWLLTALLAKEVKACLCDPASSPYPEECVSECGDSASCEYVRMQGTSSVDGGGCAGFVVKLQTRHIIS